MEARECVDLTRVMQSLAQAAQSMCATSADKYRAQNACFCRLGAGNHTSAWHREILTDCTATTLNPDPFNPKPYNPETLNPRTPNPQTRVPSSGPLHPPLALREDELSIPLKLSTIPTPRDCRLAWGYSAFPKIRDALCGAPSIPRASYQGTPKHAPDFGTRTCSGVRGDD